MDIGLLIVIGLIVLLGGAAICLGWWKLADRFFPGVARKTGQEISLRRRERERESTGGARVIARARDDHVESSET